MKIAAVVSLIAGTGLGLGAIVAFLTGVSGAAGAATSAVWIVYVLLTLGSSGALLLALFLYLWGMRARNAP